jgi:hypothetical protein
MSDFDPQEFGRLQAQVETLIASDERKNKLLETMATSISAIQLQLAEAHGGWRFFLMAGSAVGAVGGAVGWLIHEFLRFPK